MQRIVVPADLVRVLSQLRESAELFDAFGNSLGTFQPARARKESGGMRDLTFDDMDVKSQNEGPDLRLI